jgi:enoyl-CoA hydratase/3-hydroxyacyl-CoA dehydrogenase
MPVPADSPAMTVDGIDSVAVLGAGSMGHGITEVAAVAGYTVTMRDIEEELVADGYDDIEWSLGKLDAKGRIDEDPAAILDRIETTTDLEAAVADADLVIEAAPEQMALKKDIYSDLDAYTDDAILASNTSSLSITEIASATSRPEDVVGMHFFNPPVRMELVEVIYGEQTSDDTAETAHAFVESLDKTPIYVRKDVRGFVVNSVLGPFGTEPAWMVSEGIAEVREVDATLTHERGYPMGPFELADMTGIDITYHILTEAGVPIPPVMEDLVADEELGRKTGTGYYDYENGGANYEPDDATDEFDWLRVEATMINEAAKLVGNNVATPDAIDTGMRLGAGFPEGICRRADKVGLDTVVEKLEKLHAEYGDEHGDGRYEPADYLLNRVERGATGQETGEGFYEYDADDGLGDYRDIEYTLGDDGLLAITFDRPTRLNTLSPDMMAEIIDLLDSVDEEEVRAVTFEGAGDRAFCAGADVTAFTNVDPAKDSEPTEVFTAVADFPRPTLAKIDGYCLGGGLEIALGCDLRIATENSSFGFPEIDLGLIPGGGGTQRTIRQLTDARAKELVFRGEHISAERAQDWGLINRAVPADEFEATVDEFVDDLVSGPPIALRHAKRVMDHGRDQDIDAGLDLESQAFSLLLTTDDMMEGVAAFSADRDPEFEGE